MALLKCANCCWFGSTETRLCYRIPARFKQVDPESRCENFRLNLSKFPERDDDDDEASLLKRHAQQA
jgi:hypothetical protein